MRIALIGAGIIGVTTAYELAADGHEVTVFERCSGVAAEGSFANAGVLAPGYVAPWAAPGMPRKVLRQWLSRHPPLRWGGRLGPGGTAWLLKWWRNCTDETYTRNRGRMHRLALAGRTRRRALTDALQLDHERSDGYLVLLRRPQDLELAQPGLKILSDLGTRYEVLDADACRRIEPDLNPQTGLHAGIRVIDDEVANCREFAQLLRVEAQKLGARFCFCTTVHAIDPGSHPTLRFETEIDPSCQQTFDAVIVCAALESRSLLAPFGLELPLLAVHGYSITAPMRRIAGHADVGPRSGVMDERYTVSISRFGNRVRVAGSAEIGGRAGRINDKAIDTLHQVLNDWYPGVAMLDQAQIWKGARPMLPDGPPVIGASGVPGVWLNLGHGSSGWAMANGSARLLADLVGGLPPSIDAEGLGIDRL